MMKRLFMLISLAMALVPQGVRADSYTSLWKQVETAQAKDLPRNAMAALDKIVAKADGEHAYGQLLKSQLTRLSIQTSIAPDSLADGVHRLEQAAVRAEKRDPVLAAVYQSVLGTVYRDADELLLGDSCQAVSREYFKKSLHDVDALAATESGGYEPTIVKGVDSKIFHNDLLHVIGIQADDWLTLYNYYNSHDNRSAACLCALKLLQKGRQGADPTMRKSRYMQSLDSLMKVYQDLDVCGEIAIERYNFMEQADDVKPEQKYNYLNYVLTRWGSWPRMNTLRNALTQLTLPSFLISMGGGMQIPQTPRRVMIAEAVNIQELTLNVYRLNVSGDTRLDPSDTKDYAQLKRLIVGDAVFSTTKHYVGRPVYQPVRDSMEIKGLPIGVYLVEFTSPGTSIKAERALLRVSDMFVLHETLPDKKIRLVAVSATTGQPIGGARIRLSTRNYNGQADTQQTLTCDAHGEATYSYTRRAANLVYAYTDSDHAMAETSLGGGFYYSKNNSATEHVGVYTDRRIYRPGQQVHVAALAYKTLPTDETHAIEGKTVTLTLRDANYKEVAKADVVTDAYGMASTDFTLPASGLTGNFTVRSSWGNGNASLSVEEYKRPTFQVDFEKVEQRYADGDTVTVKGSAKSYAGVPVQGAKVALKVVRRPMLWWRYWSRTDDSKTVLTDTVQTDNNGTFSVRVPMMLPEADNAQARRYYAFDVQADVTDVSGETRHGETSLPLSDKPTAFSCDMPEKILRDSLRTLTFRYTNNAGEPVDGQVNFTIDGIQHTCKANTAFPLAELRLRPALHQLSATCGNDTLRQQFVVFSMSDKRPVVETHDWFYASASEFPRDGSPVYVQAGSSDANQYIVYTAIAGNQILANGRLNQSNALTTKALKYKEIYGDGLLITCAWVKNGILYKHKARIQKPLPDKRLTARWTTFRDRLTPGQRETWTLRVTRPDGKASQAQLMATLYDKSLDLLRQHKWSLSPTLYRALPSAAWSGTTLGDISLYGELGYKALRERSLDFSHFASDMFPNSYVSRDEVFIGRPRLLGAAAPMMAKSSKSMVFDTVEASAESRSANTMLMATADIGGEDDSSASTSSSDQLRENLNETAFFTPALLTDAGGNVNLSFTLPESITTWHFMGVAHDKDFNYCLVDTEAVAKKTVMIQPNVPRFVRAEDKCTIAARVFNTSDSRVSGTARLQLLNAENETVVFEQSRPYAIEANGTTAVNFDLDMARISQSLSGNPMLICRVTATGQGYEDGEQHYLPLMPDREMVTNTQSFTLNGPGVKTIDLKKLFAVDDKTDKLTVEYTDNPAWLMIQALPSVSDARDDNAISLAAAYYATSLSAAMLKQMPEIKSTILQWKKETGTETSLMSSLEKNQELKSMALDETPWVMDADHESDQKQQLINYFDASTLTFRLGNCLSKLRKLQNADGSFSWWPGMMGNLYMTTSVTKMLVRLNVLLGQPQSETAQLIDRGMTYLAKKKAEEVQELKRLAKKGVRNLLPSDAALDYLYLCAISNRDIDTKDKADISYLVGLLEKQPTALTIYGKANSAIILSKFGSAQKAAESLESIRQYTVYKEEMGRYFDTPKAQYSWCDYRIPSQVAAIEAIKTLLPSDTLTVEEMQRWLLQSKRTQSWDTPINSVNAIYAFLSGQMEKLKTTAEQKPDITIDQEPLTLPTATAGLGYVKASRTGAGMSSLTVKKASQGTSWGAAYAQFMQKTTEVSSASSGLKVRREVLDGGHALSVGDRVKVRITIEADRDYDFVQVNDRRAACLEPVGQLSGYRQGYYCTPRDNTTNYYFDRLAKGKHVIETEYYIDRKGSYSTGTCSAQCAYSPDFSGRDAARQLEVK